MRALAQVALSLSLLPFFNEKFGRERFFTFLGLHVLPNPSSNEGQEGFRVKIR